MSVTPRWGVAPPPLGTLTTVRCAQTVGVAVLFVLTSLLVPHVPVFHSQAGRGPFLSVDSASMAPTSSEKAPTTAAGSPGSRIAVATVRVGVGPDAIVYDSANAYVYVADYASANLSVVSGTSVVGTIPVGSEPWAIVYDPGNRDIYVSTLGNVAVISGMTVVATIPAGRPDALAYDSGNGYVYVANQGYSSVEVISGTRVISNLSLGGPMPDGVTYDNANGYVYVSEFQTSDVVAILGTSIVASIGVGFQGQYDSTMAYNSTTGYLYVPNSGSDNVSVVSGRSVIASVPVGIKPDSVSFDPLNGFLYVTNLGGNNVSVVDALKDVATVTVSDSPVVLAVSNSTGAVYTSSYYQPLGSPGWNNVSVILGTSLVSTAHVLGGPASLGTYDNRNQDIYIPIANGNNVTVVGQAITSFAPSRAVFPLGDSTYLNVSTIGGAPPYSYAYSGLPSGCASVNRSSILCTPVVNGTFDVTVAVSDGNGMISSSSLDLTITVVSIATFTASPPTIPLGASTDLNASVFGGIPPYSYAYSGLPQGCFSANASTLNCTPAKPGSFLVSVIVSDRHERADATVSMTVLPGPVASILPSRTSIDPGERLSFASSVAGGVSPYSYSYNVSAAGAGCATSTGPVLNCTPTQGGLSFRAQVKVTDFYGNMWTATSTIVTVYPALQANLTASNSAPLLAQTITLVANASGGVPPYNYAYLGLPYGCYSENRSTLGCLPTQSDWYNVTVAVTDLNNWTARSTVLVHVIFDFNVAAPSSTPVGQTMTISVNTNQTFLDPTDLAVPAGGVRAFTYSYSGLPPGCVGKDASSITCTPTTIGTYLITVSVHDAAGDHSSHTVVVRVTEGFLGLPGSEGYLLIGAAVAAAAVALVLVRERRPAVPAKAAQKEETETDKGAYEGEAKREPAPENEE